MSAAPKKASSPKKHTAKKQVAKAKSKTTSTKNTTTQPLQSFKPAQSTEPFFTFKITRQTVYWLILSVIVIGLAAWVLQLNARIQSIYDQIEQNSINIEALSTEKESAKKATDTAK
ncbi:hypothetical protein D3C73_17370 [compost metagenome]